ncbi:hypothetical protein [Streptomyces thermodiastaticus]|nr:hypothetical protein [Streptomyces thermodiastaticus]
MIASAPTACIHRDQVSAIAWMVTMVHAVDRVVITGRFHMES